MNFAGQVLRLRHFPRPSRLRDRVEKKSNIRAKKTEQHLPPTQNSLKTPNPSWLSSAIFYEIYPQSFHDSNGDGIGDLSGIIEKLDYIQSLGCDALWLNPCFLSPFGDAGYDVEDFYKVAPRYGTNRDLIRLFQRRTSAG